MGLSQHRKARAAQRKRWMPSRFSYRNCWAHANAQGLERKHTVFTGVMACNPLQPHVYLDTLLLRSQHSRFRQETS